MVGRGTSTAFGGDGVLRGSGPAVKGGWMWRSAMVCVRGIWSRGEWGRVGDFRSERLQQVMSTKVVLIKTGGRIRHGEKPQTASEGGLSN